MSSIIVFLIKRGKIHIKNTEKQTFLNLKDDSILRTALHESRQYFVEISTPLKPKNKTTL